MRVELESRSQHDHRRSQCFLRRHRLTCLDDRVDLADSSKRCKRAHLIPQREKIRRVLLTLSIGHLKLTVIIAEPMQCLTENIVVPVAVPHVWVETLEEGERFVQTVDPHRRARGDEDGKRRLRCHLDEPTGGGVHTAVVATTPRAHCVEKVSVEWRDSRASQLEPRAKRIGFPALVQTDVSVAGSYERRQPSRVELRSPGEMRYGSRPLALIQ